MLIKNKIDSSFGPYESFAAKLVFVAGCVGVWYSLKAILLIWVGAFFGFTYFRAAIDLDKQRVRNGDVLLGIFGTGKWVEIDPEMTVGLMKRENVRRISSLSNRRVSVPESEFMVVLFDAEGKKLMSLNKNESLESANDELFRLSDLLNLRRITP